MNKVIAAALTLKRKQFKLNADFTAPMNGITALYGPSGSGKTTVLRCLAGLEKKTRGTLRVGNEIWQDEHTFIPPHKRPIAYVFQESNLFDHLSITQNLTYGMKRRPDKLQGIEFNEALDLLDIKNILTRKTTQLSGGQRQRVAIARALLSSPQLLLMDEPLASLDIEGKAEILPYLERLHEELNIPIIYVSHDPNEVVRIADKMVLMKQGSVLAQGEINTLLTRTDLPLAHLEQACSVINGKVLRHDKQFHLSYLSIPGGIVAVSYRDLPLGYSVRARVLARDVSLALNPNEDCSITNILSVQIKAIDESPDPAKRLVTLNVGGEKILACITAFSIDRLKLKTNQKVYAQIKSVALMR